MTKTEIKRHAKEFVYQLLYQMDEPAWILNKGASSKDIIQFMIELRKIADRTVKS